MANPIKVKFFRECVPTKGVWYSLHGDIFVSVLHKSKPHVRRKAIPPDEKRDNKLSDWHREWQYDKIENQYGEIARKTYEVNIVIDNETHRIDSLVNNIAIEFQNTLSVGLEEMNIRYRAHKKYGCIPYLVLNFTNFTFSEFSASLSSDEQTPLKTKLNKWANSEYSGANMLFLDLKDCMVRIVKSIECGYVKISQTQFIEDLFNLEKELSEKINNDRKRVKHREERNRIDKEKADKRAIEKERERFYHEKFDNPDFKFYRFCFANPLIKPYVMPYNGEIFEYWAESETEFGYLKKYHRYYSKDSNFEILYKTVSKIIETEIKTNRSQWTKKEYKFDHAEIQLKNRYKIVARFKRIGEHVILIPEDKILF